MKTLLIRNARLVNEGQILEADLLVRNGRIDKIAPSIDICADEEIDAAGQWLLPGMIDDQVHFREPGLTHKGCIATESAAAVAGGITSFMDMPNTKPPTLSMAAVANKKAIAARDSLRNALNSNRLDVIGTDHAPHTRQEKAGTYFQAPSGLPLAQHALPGLMGLVHDGIIDLPTLAAKTSHRVADLFQIAERGYLREGYWADLVLIGNRDLNAPDDPILSRCGWSPFVGRRFRSRIATTVVSGQIAWHEGELRPDCRGQALSFLRKFSG